MMYTTKQKNNILSGLKRKALAEFSAKKVSDLPLASQALFNKKLSELIAACPKAAKDAELREFLSSKMATIVSSNDQARSNSAEKSPEAEKATEVKNSAEYEKAANIEQAAEALRIAEAKKIAEAEKIAEAQRIAEAKKIAEAEKAAEAQRIAETKKIAEAERVVKSEKVADVFKLRSQAAQPPKASGTDSKPLHTASAYVYTIFLYIFNSLKIVSRSTQKYLSRLIYSFHETAKKSKYPPAGIYAVGLLAFPLSVAMLIATYSRLQLMGFEFPLATVLGLEGVLYLCAFIPALLLKKIEKSFWHIIIILPLTLYTIAIFLEPSRNFIREIKPYINTYDIVTHQKQNNRLLELDTEYKESLVKINDYNQKILSAQKELAPHQEILNKYRNKNYAPDKNSREAFKAASIHEPEIAFYNKELVKYENIRKERINYFSATSNSTQTGSTDWVKISELSIDYFAKDIFLIFIALFTALLLYWFFKMLLSTPDPVNYSKGLILAHSIPSKKKDTPLADTGNSNKNDN